MTTRRILYLGVLIGCLVFYMFYREWLAWLLLIWVVALPPVSLLLSLPAMFSVSFRFHCPDRVTMGEKVKPELRMACRMPMPLVRCRIQTVSGITGEKYIYELGEALLTEHCGMRQIRIWRLWVYDYLGLFRRRIRNVEGCTMAVEPVPLPMEQLPTMERQQVSAWRPKAGGGFAENHELRLYRPGDSLRQIHWKLAAKTGKLILREPMVPIQGKMVLTLVLSGSEAMIDQKLGKLLWLSQRMLQQRLSHEIRCLTGQGLECFRITDEESLLFALHAIMAAPAAGASEVMPPALDAGWQYHIGGEADEA